MQTEYETTLIIDGKIQGASIPQAFNITLGKH